MTNLTPIEPQIMENIILKGDISKLTGPQRISYYRRLCEELHLNPFTKPFDYLEMRGKTVLYVNKDGANQLRRQRGISVISIDREIDEEWAIVWVTVKDKDGVQDMDMSAQPLVGLRGDDRANAIKKCVTQAKRRAALSICGLGFIDETEVENIPGAVKIESEVPQLNDGDNGMNLIPPKE